MRLKSRTERKLVNGNLEVTIPVFIRRERNSVILDKVEKEGKTDWYKLAPIRRRLITSFRLLDKWEKHPSLSIIKLAEEENIDRSMLNKIMSLVNLAPDIVEAIMDDPPTFDFSVKKIFSHQLPADWNEQRRFLGLPVKDYVAG
jgi:hypothetical protein